MKDCRAERKGGGEGGQQGLDCHACPSPGAVLQFILPGNDDTHQDSIPNMNNLNLHLGIFFLIPQKTNNETTLGHTIS